MAKTVMTTDKNGYIRFYDSFPDKKSAEEQIAVLDNALYYLASGEAGRPTYTARKYKDGWGIHAEYQFYRGALHPKQSGRILSGIPD